MIGIDFISFLILLIIAAIVAAVIHYGFGYYAESGVGSFLSKIVVGWVGGWLGSPVLGHWWEGVQYQAIYLVPAILGSLALTILMVDVAQTFKGKKGA